MSKNIFSFNEDNILKFISYLKVYTFEILLSKKENKKYLHKIKKIFLKEISFSKWEDFYSSFPLIISNLEKDLDFFFQSDPAAKSKEEIILTYPGFLAIIFYRFAHRLNSLNIPLISRYISEKAHSLTGIDIHPGAFIDSPFFIDHGTGIVIGETTSIGKNVKIYHGVTLGALSLKDGRLLKNKKRHPTIKDNVTIYSGASILGGDTVIGDNVTIGSNVFIIDSILSNSSILYQENLIKIKK